nr:translation initiation factor IF-2-like [Chrysemys picta bellii]
MHRGSVVSVPLTPALPLSPETRGDQAWRARGWKRPGPVPRRAPAFPHPGGPPSLRRRRLQQQAAAAPALRVAPPAASSSSPPPGGPAPGGRPGPRLGSVLEPADEPGDHDGEEGEDAGDREADGPHGGGRGRAAGPRLPPVLVDEDEAGKEQHHHGEEGEHHAHAARAQRRPLAALAALVAPARGARAGALRPRGWARLVGRGARLGAGGGARRGRQAVLGQRVAGPQLQGEGLGQLGVDGQAVHALVRQGGAVAAHRAADGAAGPGSPWRGAGRAGLRGRGALGGPQVQLAQALLAEGVQALQQLGRAPLQVEVIVADLALVVLVVRGVSGPGRRRLLLRPPAIHRPPILLLPPARRP